LTAVRTPRPSAGAPYFGGHGAARRQLAVAAGSKGK
jgi:hypothetical protein